jgi:hypothetical protein
MSPFARAFCDGHGVVLVQFLGSMDLLAVLFTSTRVRAVQPAWCRQLQDNVWRLRRLLQPTYCSRLRMPGFAGPVTISCSRPAREWRHWPLWTSRLETRESQSLLDWLEWNGLEAFSPAEAVLVLNAWPVETRRAGAALSDFLRETNAEFLYGNGLCGLPRQEQDGQTLFVTAVAEPELLIHVVCRNLPVILTVQPFRVQR